MSLRHEPEIPWKDLRADALLVTAAENVRYLTGFTGTNGLVLLFRDREPVFFTDPRYAIQSAQEVPCRTVVVPKGGLIPAAAKLLKKVRAKAIGFDRVHLTFAAFEKLASELGGGAKLVPVDDLIARRRMVKAPEELAVIREAVLINSRAFEAALKAIKPGVTESRLAATIEDRMRRFGAEKPSFDTIVAAGARTALPHARPTDQRLQGNELVLVDMGALRHGYASDMTRTLYLGRPSPKVRRMYGAVLEAQLAGIAAVRPGATAEQVDRACRKVLKSHGLDKYFTHSTGHGLGLEIHEAPRLGKGDTTRLEAGMAITIEPGVYIEGFGGIRIEDTVAVTPNGCEVLTPTPKEFLTI